MQWRSKLLKRPSNEIDRSKWNTPAICFKIEIKNIESSWQVIKWNEPECRKKRVKLSTICDSGACRNTFSSNNLEWSFSAQVSHNTAEEIWSNILYSLSSMQWWSWNSLMRLAFSISPCFRSGVSLSIISFFPPLLFFGASFTQFCSSLTS